MNNIAVDVSGGGNRPVSDGADVYVRDGGLRLGAEGSASPNSLHYVGPCGADCSFYEYIPHRKL